MWFYLLLEIWYTLVLLTLGFIIINFLAKRLLNKTRSTPLISFIVTISIWTIITNSKFCPDFLSMEASLLGFIPLYIIAIGLAILSIHLLINRKK